MLKPLVALALTACACYMPAQSTDKSVHLSNLQSLVPDKERTQVMVLATFHFAQYRNEFKPVMVKRLMEQLEAFQPEVIAVENLSGERIHELELRSSATDIHEFILNEYAGIELKLGHEAQKLLGTDCIQARKKVVLGTLPSCNSEEKLDKALHCLAAYELATALLTWSDISPEEKGSLDIPPELAKRLDAVLGQINEVQQLAIPLAKKLGLDSIASVDEFEALEANTLVWEKLAKNPPVSDAREKPTIFAESDKRRRQEAIDNEDLLPYFRSMNSDQDMQEVVMPEWRAYLRSNFKDRSDRGRLATWENRNMKIAANIRALTALNPGKRILVIYGAAHKPFLDAYLSHASDIQIVQPNFNAPKN